MGWQKPASLPMAKPIFFLLASIAIVAATGKDFDYGKKKVKAMNEKASEFKLYWHDKVTEPDATSIIIIKPKTFGSAFGQVNMIDNPMTDGWNMNSKLIGRAQGFYAATSEDELALLMVMNMAFVDGKYNGSTLTVYGRNPIFSAARELSIIGGSGLFRFARGFVKLKTIQLEFTGDATVEYSFYVLHY